MVELVDTRDLKSLGHRLCRFKPGSGYQTISSGYRFIFCSRFFCFVFFTTILQQLHLELFPAPPQPPTLQHTQKFPTYVSSINLSTLRGR